MWTTSPSSPVPWPPQISDGRDAPVHAVENCLGSHCPFHNPSDHHMNRWPIGIGTVIWTSGIGLSMTMHFDAMSFRMCPHERIHPDPDSLDWLLRRGAPMSRISEHAPCDGCCGVVR